MLVCPNCQHQQLRTPLAKGVVWVCESCKGRLAHISALRKLLDRKTVEDYWKRARMRTQADPSPRACPVCQFNMRLVDIVLNVSPDFQQYVIDLLCALLVFTPIVDL